MYAVCAWRPSAYAFGVCTALVNTPFIRTDMLTAANTAEVHCADVSCHLCICSFRLYTYYPFEYPLDLK